MSVKEDLDKKLTRQREDAAALAATMTQPAVPASPSVKDYPRATAVAVTRNGSVLVTY